MLAFAACATATHPVAPAPAPAPETPTAAPTPSVTNRAAVIDSAEADRVPAFQTEPLIAWGPLPPGTIHEPQPRTYDLRHQTVHVRLDWEQHAIIGTTTLRLAALAAPIKTVALDAVGMTIARVTDATGRRLKFTYNDTTLSVQLARRLAARASTLLTVAYQTVKPTKGAYFIDRMHVLWTQGETEDNRYWVPTYDHPDDKTTWQITVVTDTNERALSNGRLVSSRRVRDEGRAGIAWTWAQEKPASTYLMSVVTGNYTVVSDKWHAVPLGYWTYPDSIEAVKRGFGKTPEAVDVFSRKTGVPYPWAKYDQSVVPDFIFGGMENVTATTQNDNAILHPAWAEPQSNADGLMAHELAHQWYGDLLTTKSWGHVWLNEGFATFMAQIFTEESAGVDEGALDRLGAQEQTIDADRQGRRPIVYERWVDNPIEVFFSGHIYPKGATVMQMLRHQLGDSLFWAAMHHYTVTHAYGSVVTDDLRRAFEESTGRDFRPFFDQWVYGAGFPVFRVSFAYDTVTKQLTLDAAEAQARDSLTGYFDADVAVEALTDAGPVRGVVPVHGGTGRVVLALSGPPRSIRWNKGKWILELTDFPRPTSMLSYQLAHDDDVLGRVEAVDLLRRRLAQPRAVTALVHAATIDKFWGVRNRAVRALATADTSDTARTGVVRGALIVALRDSDARVRQSAAAGLRKFPSAELRPVLEQAIRSDPSLFVRGSALASYLTVMGDAGLPLAEEVMAMPSWLDALRGPAMGVLKEMPSAGAQALYQRYAK